MTATNIEAFKQLIERYESITIAECIKAFATTKDGGKAAQRITGYGSSDSCMICINTFCYECVWYEQTGKACFDGKNMETYTAIRNSETAEELLKAFRARAAYMRETLELRSEQINVRTLDGNWEGGYD